MTAGIVLVLVTISAAALTLPSRSEPVSPIGY